MKLILIDGGPASGKSTLGQILRDSFSIHGEKSILLDLDSYVEELCPTYVWDSIRQKQKDLRNARAGFRRDIVTHLRDNSIVIAIGDRFLTHSDLIRYTKKLDRKYHVFLYHLSAPLPLRRQRLDARGPHPLINLDKHQKGRDAVTSRPRYVWLGYVYHNTNTPDVDATNLAKLIQSGVGLVSVV